MNRHAAFTRRWRQGWLRRVAAAFLLAAFTALVLQATAHVGLAGHVAHDDQTFVAQGCDHSHAVADSVPQISGDRCSPGDSGLNPQDDCCNQICIITALLPEGTRADLPSGGEALLRLWSDRHGRTPEGILRPPRSSAAA